MFINVLFQVKHNFTKTSDENFSIKLKPTWVKSVYNIIQIRKLIYQNKIRRTRLGDEIHVKKTYILKLVYIIKRVSEARRKRIIKCRWGSEIFHVAFLINISLRHLHVTSARCGVASENDDREKKRSTQLPHLKKNE